MSIDYVFPHIENIDDVIHIFKDNENFIVAKKDGYTVINYLRAGKETHPLINSWEDTVLREARGIIFDSETGEIISRRFHKFFNLGEREDVMTVDLSQPHVIMEKLDGSMITPIPLKNGFRWGTKMGITEVAMQAEEFVAKNSKYEFFAAACGLVNCTPIFEWVSRQQRIVLDYPEDNLILTAIRNNWTGEYVSRPRLMNICTKYDIPLVKVVSSLHSNQEELIEFVRKQEGIEGFVIQFNNGHMVKLKTDEYVALHRAKSLLDNERDVVGLILDEKVDDLLPILPDNDKLRLEEFSKAVWYDIGMFRWNVNSWLVRIFDEGWTRKDFAIATDGVDSLVRTLVFANFGKEECSVESIVDYVKKHLGSKSQFDKCGPIFKTAHWKEQKND